MCVSARVQAIALRTWIEYKIYKFCRWNGISAMPTIFSSNGNRDEHWTALTIFMEHFIRTEKTFRWARAQNPCKWETSNPIEKILFFSSNSFILYLIIETHTYCHFGQCDGVVHITLRACVEFEIDTTHWLGWLDGITHSGNYSGITTRWIHVEPGMEGKWCMFQAQNGF